MAEWQTSHGKWQVVVVTIPGRISWMNLRRFCICHAFSRSALNVEKQSTNGCVLRVEAPQYPSEFHDIFMGFTSIDRLDLTGFVGASNP